MTLPFGAEEPRTVHPGPGQGQGLLAVQQVVSWLKMRAGGAVVNGVGNIHRDATDGVDKGPKAVQIYGQIVVDG